jgi:hypothetical protein
MGALFQDRLADWPTGRLTFGRDITQTQTQKILVQCFGYVCKYWQRT